MFKSDNNGTNSSVNTAKRTEKTYRPKLLGPKKYKYSYLAALVIGLSVVGYFISHSFASVTVPHVKIIGQNAEVYDGEFLIKIRPQVDNKTNISNSDQKTVNPHDTGLNSLNQVNKKNGAIKIKKIVRKDQAAAQADVISKSGFDRWYKVEVSKKSNKRIISKDDKNEYAQYKQVLNDYKIDPAIEKVEPNFVVKANRTPNDPYYSSSNSWGQGYGDLWGLKKINPEAGWDGITSGLSTMPTAIIDTGVDYNHSEFTGMRWVNPKETANSIDDDGNGLVDDISGWDFANNDKDPFDDHGHGTHITGIITAQGNNAAGMVGVDWASPIIPIKVLDKDGFGSSETVAQGLKYAADIGAKISNNSYAGPNGSQIEAEAIQYEHDKGMVIVAAAGNEGSNALDSYPASDQNVITVGATDSQDNLAVFSNTGPKIDVVAPGVDILSTKSSADSYCATQGSNFVIGSKYCRYSGTSMAAPYVTGLVALLRAKNPSVSNEVIRQMIRAGATDLGPAGRDDKFGYGRIDVSKSLSITRQTNLPPYISSPRNGQVVQGSSLDIIGSAQLAISGPNQILEYGYGTSPTSWTAIPGMTPLANQSKLVTWNLSGVKDGDVTIRLRQKSNSSLQEEQVFSVHIKVDNLNTKISNPFVAVPQNGSVKITGTAAVSAGVSFSSYSLSWGEGSSPSTFSNSNISLTSGGLTQVNNALLGTWNTTALKKDTTYTLKLTVNTSAQNSETILVPVRIDADLKAGWPASLLFSTSGDLTLADLNGDGKAEIISDDAADLHDLGGGVRGWNDANINAYQSDGTMLAGFPIKHIAGTTSDTEILDNTPIADDVDGDGKKELLSAGDVFLNGGFWSDHKEINLYNYQGKQYPGFPVIKRSYDTYSKWGSGEEFPILADLNSDGKKEIIYVEYQNSSSNPSPYAKIHAIQLNGIELGGFPKQISLPVITNDPNFKLVKPVVADVNKDGSQDLVWSYYNQLYIFKYASGKLDIVPGWPFSLPANLLGSDNTYSASLATTPAIGNIDNDTENEAVFYIENDNKCKYENLAKCRSTILPLNYNATKSSPAYPIFGIVPWQTEGLITMADINGDGKDDILVPSNKNGSTNSDVFDILKVFDGSANQILASTLPTNGNSAVVADIEDGQIASANPEIITGGTENNNIYVNIANSTNSSLWKKTIPMHFHTDSSTNTSYPVTWLNALQSVDLDNDKRPEIITQINDYDIESDNYLNGIFVWQYPKLKSTNMAFNWPMRAHDAQGTSNVGLNRTTVPPTPSPSPSPTSPPTTLSAPTNLQTIPTSLASNSWIWLKWLGVPNAKTYNVYRNGAKASTGAISSSTPIGYVQTVDTTAPGLVSQIYTVRAVDSNGIESASSNAIAAKCDWLLLWFCK